MTLSEFLNSASQYGSGLGMLTTAAATVVLCVVTWILARHTRALVEANSRIEANFRDDAKSRPHVVAIIEPNRWAINQADLSVENTGSATAYDIRVEFDPQLQRNGGDAPEAPLSRISVLKPGQGLRVYLSEFEPVIKTKFEVRVTWLRAPKSRKREVNEYQFDTGQYEGFDHLGPSDPVIQIAEQMKKIREDWGSIARGSKKLRADVYTSTDRKRARMKRREELKRQRGERTP